MSSVATPLETTPENGAIGSASPLLKKKKNKRLASDVIGQLEDKLKENNVDIATWLELINEIEKKDKIEQVRETHEKFLKKFPFLSQQWIRYIEYELNRGEFDKVEELFRRCLINVTSVALWRCYVSYVRRKNNLITGGEEARRTIFKAYELSVEKVGIDPESGLLWEEFLKFIDDWKPVSSFDEQQKMDMKRRTYKKALAIPLNNLEKLWADYTKFENDLNSTTARKFISDISGSYMNARSWNKEWNNLTQGLRRFDDGQIPKEGDYDKLQLNKWRSWIKWEKLNQLEYSEEKVAERLDYIYKQAIQALPFYPEIWFEFVDFYQDSQFFSTIKAQELLEESLLVNPTAFSLNFRSIELYELDQNSSLVTKKYESLIEHLTQDHNRHSEEIEEIKDYLFEEAYSRKVRDYEQKPKDDNDDINKEVKPLSDEEKDHIVKSNSFLQVKVQALQKLSKTITLTYCQYMSAIKRLKGVKEARPIFALCRKSKRTLTHHIFVEAAHLEFNAGEQSLPLKIFELGLKPSFFPNDGEYLYKYLKFLIKINDATNSRSLFETTVNTKKDIIEPHWLKKIFNVFIKYESTFGQISSLAKIEKKYFEAFPEDAHFLLFANRYSFNEEFDFDIENDLIRFNDLKETEAPSIKRKIENAEEDIQIKKPRFEGEDEQEFGNRKVIDGDEGPSQFVTDEIYNLLRVLPSASYFDSALFDNYKLVELLKSIDA